MTGKEFAHSVGIKKSFGTEFNKMKNIVNRLKEAGLNLPKI
ncbi:HTH-like domain-containing protein [Pseudovibrio sp. Ad5]